MRALGIGLIVFAALSLLALMGCWAAAVWLEDIRWGSTAFILFVVTLIVGFAAGMILSFLPP
jgi:hypothetical protein